MSTLARKPGARAKPAAGLADSLEFAANLQPAVTTLLSLFERRGRPAWLTAEYLARLLSNYDQLRAAGLRSAHALDLLAARVYKRSVPTISKHLQIARLVKKGVAISVAREKIKGRVKKG